MDFAHNKPPDAGRGQAFGGSEQPRDWSSVPKAAESDDRPVLLSACLAGRPCRYDATSAAPGAGAVEALLASRRAVLVCPEVDGGLPTPRPAAEIVGGDGADVLAGRARVVTQGGEDVTALYLAGARRALARARETGAAAAILKARSPSCGKGCIHDGTFSKATRTGDGVTTALLEQHGIAVFSDEDVDAPQE